MYSNGSKPMFLPIKHPAIAAMTLGRFEGFDSWLYVSYHGIPWNTMDTWHQESQNQGPARHLGRRPKKPMGESLMSTLSQMGVSMAMGVPQ